MEQNYATFLGFTITFVALFSCAAVVSWVHARRHEREAFYRSEAIKKVAEMQGMVPDAVLQVLREALTPKPEFPKWPPAAADAYRREREAYYKSETLKKIAEMQGAGAGSVLEYLREEDRHNAGRHRESMKLGGLLTAAVGVGLLIALRVMMPDRPTYVVGIFPTLVGAAVFVYAYILAPRETLEKRS